MEGYEILIMIATILLIMLGSNSSRRPSENLGFRRPSRFMDIVVFIQSEESVRLLCQLWAQTGSLGAVCGEKKGVPPFYAISGSVFPVSRRTSPLRSAPAIFLKLWAAQASENSPLTFLKPRNRNPRKPLFFI
jgi:hypothetical protein